MENITDIYNTLQEHYQTINKSIEKIDIIMEKIALEPYYVLEPYCVLKTYFETMEPLDRMVDTSMEIQNDIMRSNISAVSSKQKVLALLGYASSVTLEIIENFGDIGEPRLEDLKNILPSLNTIAGLILLAQEYFIADLMGLSPNEKKAYEEDINRKKEVIKKQLEGRVLIVPIDNKHPYARVYSLNS